MEKITAEPAVILRGSCFTNVSGGSFRVLCRCAARVCSSAAQHQRGVHAAFCDSAVSCLCSQPCHWFGELQKEATTEQGSQTHI